MDNIVIPNFKINTKSSQIYQPRDKIECLLTQLDYSYQG